jgi:hypothetical protein
MSWKKTYYAIFAFTFVFQWTREWIDKYLYFHLSVFYRVWVARKVDTEGKGIDLFYFDWETISKINSILFFSITSIDHKVSTYPHSAHTKSLKKWYWSKLFSLAFIFYSFLCSTCAHYWAISNVQFTTM